MSRLNLPPRNEGHRLQNPTGDVDNKLSYQQLLNICNDFQKENTILRDTTKRLGEELSKLQVEFDIKPPQDTMEEYNLISAHPILCKFESTLLPLFDAYEYKIKEFEQGFQSIYLQFFDLEKKFEEVCKENEQLKSRLTSTIKELIDVYRNGSNEKIHSDFGQIILDQINQKQKLLVEQNALLERDYQKWKAESERYQSQLEAEHKRLEETKAKLRDAEISLKQLQTQNSSLSKSSFQLQIKMNEVQAQKRKLEQAHERAQSQNNQLNKDKQYYKNKLDELKVRIQKDTNIAPQNDQGKLIQQLQTKISWLEAEQAPNDAKKLSKLQKQYDALVKEKQRLKEALDNSKIREDQLNESVAELKSEISKISLEKSTLETNEARVKKSLQNLSEKSKNDLLKAKKQTQEEVERVEQELRNKIEQKDRKIAELDEAIDKIKLEKDRVEKEIMIYGKENKTKPAKDSERAMTKMKQKMSISEDLFKQQLQILENDLSFMKRQLDAQKNESKQKTEELNRLRSEYDHLKKLYEEVSSQKETLVSEFKRVRNEYENHLKQKQSNFEEKIREIRALVQESDNKRRTERERVQEATRQYKRVLEDIKNAYEARIRELENQVTQVSYTRTEFTPGQ